MGGSSAIELSGANCKVFFFSLLFNGTKEFFLYHRQNEDTHPNLRSQLHGTVGYFFTYGYLSCKRNLREFFIKIWAEECWITMTTPNVKNSNYDATRQLPGVCARQVPRWDTDKRSHQTYLKRSFKLDVLYTSRVEGGICKPRTSPSPPWLSKLKKLTAAWRSNSCLSNIHSITANKQ